MLRRLVSLLSSKGNKEELLSGLKTPRWESKCRLIVKQEKEEKVESEVNEKAEDKRWTLESGRPARSIRNTARWEPFKSGLKEVDVRLPDRRSREAKKGFLQLAGDGAGAKSVEGGWQGKPRGDGRAWEERQAGTKAVVAFWEAQREKLVPAFLQELREKGHVGANAGAKVFLTEKGFGKQQRGIEREEKEHWMRWLEWEAQFSRQEQWQPTVITWNVGPVGYELTKTQIAYTLRKRAAVVMFQECSFATGMRARLKRELEQMCPEYWFVMEAGKDRQTDPVVEYDENEKGCRWHTNKSYAVVTCLHKKIFKKPKRREWFNEKEQKEMRYMTRGRILWTDVMTHTGRWMRVVNVHER